VRKVVRVGDVYSGGGGRFLSAAVCDEIELWDEPLTIENVEVRELQGRKKLVVSFDGMTVLLVLNRTNAMILAQAFGEETDNWKGKSIVLKKTKRSFRGKLVDAIEVQPIEEEQDLSKNKKRKGKR